MSRVYLSSICLYRVGYGTYQNFAESSKIHFIKRKDESILVTKNVFSLKIVFSVALTLKAKNKSIFDVIIVI